MLLRSAAMVGKKLQVDDKITAWVKQIRLRKQPLFLALRRWGLQSYRLARIYASLHCPLSLENTCTPNSCEVTHSTFMFTMA